MSDAARGDPSDRAVTAEAPGPQRADLWLVSHGLCPSRARAQAEIEAGHVWLGEAPITRPGQKVPQGMRLECRGLANPFVSRGGLKLAHALDHFSISVTGLSALDLGASTGGFTDVLLQRGARLVQAVDVGHGQLDPRLARDERVVSLEGLNARHLEAEHLQGRPDIIVCDVSFISLTLALPAGLALAAPGAHMVALIKPQFEAGRGQVGKGGVVRDPQIREDVCRRIDTWVASQPSWRVMGIVPSPILGPQGNAEYLLAAKAEG